MLNAEQENPVKAMRTHLVPVHALKLAMPMTRPLRIAFAAGTESALMEGDFEAAHFAAIRDAITRIGIVDVRIRPHLGRV